MRLVVFGASGGTGRETVRQALAAGHEVTAVVRSPERAGLGTRDGLEVVAGDVMDPASIFPLLKERDAVVSALGARGKLTDPTTVCADGTAAIVEAMRTAELRRIVVISAATVTTEGDDLFTRAVAKPVMCRILRHPRADSLRMEEILRGTDLDWTSMRPPRLTDGPRTGRYRLAYGRNVRGGFVVSRADLAAAVLAVLPDPATHGIGVGVAR